MKIKSLLIVLAVLTTMLLAVVAPATTQRVRAETEKGMLVVFTQVQGPTDPAEMEAFMDNLLKREMDENHIVGAAVSVVKDGQLFFAKGYGYADLENNVPVDPEQTLFKIGSVTKLFTWTAVMQLVEQGKLDLDADVNAYLDFHIPDTYPQRNCGARTRFQTDAIQDQYQDQTSDRRRVGQGD